jgi:transcriptional antiterminator
VRKIDFLELQASKIHLKAQNNKIQYGNMVLVSSRKHRKQLNDLIEFWEAKNIILKRQESKLFFDIENKSFLRLNYFQSKKLSSGVFGGSKTVFQVQILLFI